MAMPHRQIDTLQARRETAHVWRAGHPPRAVRAKGCCDGPRSATLGLESPRQGRPFHHLGEHPMPVKLAIATSAAYPTIQPDDAHLAASLAALDIQLHACVWNDPGADWAGHDAVLVRTIWDYFEHYDAFLAWLDRLERAGVPVINPVA